MHFEYTIVANDFNHAGYASSDLKKRMKQLNIPTGAMKRAVVALFESEVNVVAHSLGGVLEADIHPDRIHVLVKDQGPGIPDIDLAMTEGYSTAKDEVREMGYGAGMGLPNIRNNSDSLQVRSGANQPTEIEFEVRFSGAPGETGLPGEAGAAGETGLPEATETSGTGAAGAGSPGEAELPGEAGAAGGAELPEATETSGTGAAGRAELPRAAGSSKKSGPGTSGAPGAPGAPDTDSPPVEES
jgi:serine/threonine-protein kinase RsbT